ncbi:hypothetical protein CRV24_001566 [Beauveria bassiana]|nr:hypothetical protein CRV24_001566 [Beauveria bassiana]KAH8719825.1 hypothetical protein HC256_000247 [Beauveria bassiana]
MVPTADQSPDSTSSGKRKDESAKPDDPVFTPEVSLDSTSQTANSPTTVTESSFAKQTEPALSGDRSASHTLLKLGSGQYEHTAITKFRNIVCADEDHTDPDYTSISGAWPTSLSIGIRVTVEPTSTIALSPTPDQS